MAKIQEGARSSRSHNYQETFKIIKNFTVCQGTQWHFCHRSLCLASDSPSMSEKQEKHIDQTFIVTLALLI